MLEIVAAAAGSILAGAWDLRTTEVPDEIPVLMVAFGIFMWFVSALNGNPMPLIISIGIGSLVLFVGLVLYRHGKWGAADAWILASILYLIPFYNSKIFAFDYLSNLIWVSAAYTIAYALVMGIANKRVFKEFATDIKANIPVVLGLPLLAAGAFLLLIYATLGPVPLKSIADVFVLILLFMVFWRYAKIIETRVFVRRIPSNKLKSGDVLNDMIWRGLTQQEVRMIQKSKKFVTIKEGMRFVPVFPITLLVTLLFGNIMLWFL